jgi:hypothetical protein
MDAGPELITMAFNLPVVNYNKRSTKEPIERCPTGAIVWLEKDGTATKGRDAKKIIRKGERKAGFS